ncbi:MAG: hypothetical protein U0521_08930 [Anaerolineae bacterium]
MNKRRHLAKFALRGLFWGAVAGVLGALPLIFFFVFGSFGLFFAVVFTLIPGALLGMINGITFAILTFYSSVENEVQFHRRMLTTSMLVTLISGLLLYTPILYLLTLNGENAVVGATICATPIAVADTLVAGLASQRVKYRGT